MMRKAWIVFLALASFIHLALASLFGFLVVLHVIGLKGLIVAAPFGLLAVMSVFALRRRLSGDSEEAIRIF